MVETEHLNKTDWKEKVINFLHQEVDPKVLHKKFDLYIDYGLKRGEKIPTNSGILYSKMGSGISKDELQQEMYAMGYKRIVKKEDVDRLTSKYFVSKNKVENFQEEHARFFVQVFPETGEDNLVVFYTEKDTDLIQYREYVSQDYVNSRVAANKIEKETRPILNTINFDDQKAKINLVYAAGINATTIMLRNLGMSKSA